MPQILIIEDDALLSHMYQKLFLAKRYSVDVAENGQEGIDHARTHRPDVILLDIMMPGMNGLDTLRAIKSDPSLAKIPVIILTNLAGNNDVKIALELGASHYLIKSENRPRQVEEIVRGVLEGQNLS